MINKRQLLLSVITICIVFTKSHAQQQYSTDQIIKISGVINDPQTYPLTNAQMAISRTYYDGLGQPLQGIQLQASPAQKDIIQPVSYDNLGRQTTTYLPYADESSNTSGSYRANAISTDQPAFYNNTSQHLVASDGTPYSQNVFENTPLQRLLQSGRVGTGFQPVSGQKYKSVIYRSNNSSDGNILLWNVDGSYTTNSYYSVNTLAVVDGKDEDNYETLTFSDNVGHTILKRQVMTTGNLDTYYIYNAVGLLSFVIPPNAVARLATNSYNLSAIPVSNMIFKMVYNSMGLPVERTVPGKGTMYIVYDPLNRPVLSQDAVLASQNKWRYTKYDAQKRVISSGIYVDNTNIGRVNMQAYVSQLSYSTNWCETRSTTLTNGGYYTNVSFPTGSGGTITPFIYNYYDDYDVNNDGIADFRYIIQNLTNEESPTSAQIKGVPTVTTELAVDSGVAANTWLTKVIFYDKRGNIIQVQSNNQVYYQGAFTLTDVSTNVCDFTGLPQITAVSQKTSASNTITVQTNFTYDNMGRMSTLSQGYNGGTMKQIAAYTYNELGQVIKKSLGQVTGTTYLQNLDYRYDIHGQVVYINNSTLNNDSGTTNNDSNDLFGMQILYDQVDANLNNSPAYSGQISGIKWMSKNANGVSTSERSFTFNYDGAGRYMGQAYAERQAGGGTFNYNLHGFDETISGYDPSGNITGLSRNASTQGTNSHVQIDNLTYTYDVNNNPDRLLTVADGVSGSNNAGFINYTNSSSSYLYDANGNLKSDPYKGLGMTYDDLNHIDKTTFSYNATNRWIDYTYDASGALLRKRQYDNNTLASTTDYIGSFAYVNGVLSYFGMPEGRVVNNGGSLYQEYIITDQQGNARISFKDNGSGTATVTQETSYYGFGLQLPNSPVGLTATSSKNLYNGGAEWQNNYGPLPDYYMTRNRNYDAALGRWTAVDRMAKKYENMSPYQYASNNPIMLNDPDGNCSPCNVPPSNAPATASEGQIYNENGNEYVYTAGSWVNVTPGAHQPPQQPMTEGDYSGLADLVNVLNKYPIGLLQAAAIAYTESLDGKNITEIQAIAGAIKDRINESGTSLYDPNWAKHTSYGKNDAISGGSVTGNYNVVKGADDPQSEYYEVMHMTVDGILGGHNGGLQAALDAFSTANWSTDYSNPRGFADTRLYYWSATNALATSQYGDGTGYVITLVAGGTTFYRPN